MVAKDGEDWKIDKFFAKALLGEKEVMDEHQNILLEMNDEIILRKIENISLNLERLMNKIDNWNHRFQNRNKDVYNSSFVELLEYYEEDMKKLELELNKLILEFKKEKK